MENKKKKNFTAGQFITCAVFLVLIMGFTVAGILSPDREFSDMENRTLQTFPEFSFEKMKGGSFTSDIEQYMNDQIFLKDELVTLKTFTDQALQKDLINGVYIGSDGYYLQDFQFDEELMRKNIGCLNDFAESIKGQAECTLLAAPNAVCIMSEKLPKNVQTDDQGEALKFIESELSGDIRFADPTAQLTAALHQIPTEFYYRTDHHWTDMGATYGFYKLMDVMGEERADAHFSCTTLKDFYGTLYSKAPTFGAQSDEIHILIQDEENPITVRYVSASGDHDLPEDCVEVDGVPTREGLYDLSKAETKDKYAAIMGGNFALVEIEAEGAKNDEHILILKDSYANAMLPELCSQYKHISLIDLRYYHMEEMTVSEYVKANDIHKVIFLYNVDFLNTDNNFVWLD